MKPILVDDANSLVEPALHDARLYRIDFGGKQVSCYFENPSGQHVQLDLLGVVQMSSSGLAEANILLDISVETGPDVRTEVVNQLVSGNTQAQKAHREAIVLRLRAGELKLLQFSPSYGGEIIAICEGVTYRAE